MITQSSRRRDLLVLGKGVANLERRVRESVVVLANELKNV